jgi:NADPH:quinone reductase-like Zn-dependent oxidoreductase
MRAAIFHEFGGPEVVRIEEVPDPVAGPGELLLEVRAAALNHLDLWVRRGLPIETTMPHIGGSDIAGRVLAVGEGVDPARVGERVVVNPGLWDGTCPWCRRGEESLCVAYRIVGEHTNGGFAERLCVRADRAYPLPDALSFESAAALPVSYMTAWRALHGRARLQPGEDVLVLGASGGTALAAVQIAVRAGARVFAVTSGAERVEKLRGLGAAFVYDRAVDDWGRAVFWKHLSVLGTPMASRAEFEAMLAAACSGELVPVIDQVLPLEAAREAHQRLEEGKQFGKIVLVP